jgi:hypothetical protein
LEKLLTGGWKGEEKGWNRLSLAEQTKAETDEAKRQTDIEKARETSQALGTARTISSFVGGGANVVSAGLSLGASFSVDFDQLKDDMLVCEAKAEEIEAIRLQLMGEEMGHPLAAEMDRIVQACQGFNIDNIDVVRRNLVIGGVVSAVGAGTGIAGGIISHRAVSAEKEAFAEDKDASHLRDQNMASNVLAGVTAGASLAAGLLTGIPLVNLNRNAEVAKRCAEAF